MGRSNKKKHFLDHYRPVRKANPDNFRLSIGPDPKISTLCGLSTESLPDLGRSLPSARGQNWSWNASQMLVKFMTKGRHCGQRMLPATPVNKGCWSHQAFSHCNQPPMVHPEGIQDGEKQGTGPGIVKVNIKGIISLSPDLHLPIYRKALNSLTWAVCFFFS